MGKVELLLRRVLLALYTLLGRCDNLYLVAGMLDEERRVNDAMHKSILQMQKEKQYWFDLWMNMSRQFEAGQNALIEKIDELRQKCGEFDKPFMDGLLQKGFHETFVEPKEHPIACLKERYEGTQILPPPPRKNPSPSASKQP